MTAIILGLFMVAVFPVPGVQWLGVIVALFGWAWVAVERSEREDA